MTTDHRDARIPLVVGMAATYSNGRDRWPVVVASVSESGKTLYTLEGRHSAPIKWVLQADGHYRRPGMRWTSLYLGDGETYRDPHF